MKTIAENYDKALQLGKDSLAGYANYSLNLTLEDVAWLMLGRFVVFHGQGYEHGVVLGFDARDILVEREKLEDE